MKSIRINGYDCYGDEYVIHNEDGFIGIETALGVGYIEFNSLADFDKYISKLQEAREILSEGE
ncbi:Uncharacterised protein [Streptococcus pneumoniae]|nr:Uncharacterised protein [Streptococcus pneumoniae]